MPYVVYILECSDGSYYAGSTADLSKRLWEHEIGALSSAYTYSRRPVKLVWASEEVARYSDALRFERQIKGWSRAKKEALIRGSYEAVHEVVKRKENRGKEIKEILRAERNDECFLMSAVEARCMSIYLTTRKLALTCTATGDSLRSGRMLRKPCQQICRALIVKFFADVNLPF